MARVGIFTAVQGDREDAVSLYLDEIGVQQSIQRDDEEKVPYVSLLRMTKGRYKVVVGLGLD
jgi:hypothetical protein